MQKQKQEKMHQNPHKTNHQPVLLAETLKYLEPIKGDSYLDVTAGYGGHARAILELTSNYKDAVLIDRDKHAVKELKAEFKDSGVAIRHMDYLSASRELLDSDKRFDLILADLGVSSPHLNEVNRGFSFGIEGPLDMRMDQDQDKTAWDVVNKASEEELADILWRFGEEPKARQIARQITKSRPVNTTAELADIAKKAWPGRSKVHPATRTFQAIRIAVNNELDQLNQALPIWLKLLNPGGRLAIISFHSLEDRLVKQFMAGEAGNRYDSTLRILTKRPVMADPREIANNPRSRSAKLRVAVKQK